MPKGVESIVRVRKPVVDRLKPQPAGAEDRATFANCEVLPRQPIETADGYVAVEGWDVWCFDPTIDVIHTDQVELRGQLYNVVGEPQRFTRRGKFKAARITLKAVA